VEKEPVNRYKGQTNITNSKKSDFMDLKKKTLLNEPGPAKYNFHLKDSIEYHSNKLKNVNNTKNFDFNFQPNKKVCHQGMENSFYLKGSPGVGTYLGNEIVNATQHKNSPKQSFTKTSRFEMPLTMRGIKASPNLY